jgi:hypothetical protein
MSNITIPRAIVQQALEALWFANARDCFGSQTIEKAIASLQAALAQQAPHPDTIRLAYLYGGEKTASDALMNAQLRLFLGGALTLDEARAAIDDAMANPMEEAGE